IQKAGIRASARYLEHTGCLLFVDLQVEPLRLGKRIERAVGIRLNLRLRSRCCSVQQSHRFDLLHGIDEPNFNFVLCPIAVKLELPESDRSDPSLEHPS